ncbi:Uncharacterized protein Rs2_09721 [Raphanus sativus]|nr:Uncharacterized protein Rs2_09721 [Raphanus sativus]
MIYDYSWVRTTGPNHRVFIHIQLVKESLRAGQETNSENRHLQRSTAAETPQTSSHLPFASISLSLFPSNSLWFARPSSLTSIRSTSRWSFARPGLFIRRSSGAKRDLEGFSSDGYIDGNIALLLGRRLLNVLVVRKERDEDIVLVGPPVFSFCTKNSDGNGGRAYVGKAQDVMATVLAKG